MGTDSIVKKVGKLPGKTVAVFAGVHGNEKVGILTLDKFIKELEIESGIAYFVYANPPAIEKNVRMVDKNLNRLFFRENTGDTYEDKRAVELMDILDECEALLDLHSYNSESGDQFAITEENGYDLVSKMDFPIVASGFSNLGGGTDGYMHKKGKIGICIECGTTNKHESFLGLAENSIYQFLQYFGCIEKRVEYSNVSQRHLRVKEIISKKNDNFRFSKEFRTFDLLPAGEPFMFDGDVQRTALNNECILFPQPKTKVGDDAGIIGEFID
ncbi:MAG: succinylglutamate desuccinylase/aspartoacylase family protein [Candidatus Pacebacteria bacterium]|nr:succinylglutamate desuccinylase/aspartoacylase family protein [Candidatus Paceibacterota bacterium]